MNNIFWNVSSFCVDKGFSGISSSDGLSLIIFLALSNFSQTEENKKPKTEDDQPYLQEELTGP